MKRMRVLILIILLALSGCAPTVTAAPLASAPPPVRTAAPAPVLTPAPIPSPTPSPDPRIPAIGDLSVDGRVVRFVIQNGAAPYRYCFTAADTAPEDGSPDWLAAPEGAVSVLKTDGAYRVFALDAAGALSAPVSVCVDAGSLPPLNGEGLLPLSAPLSELLTDHGDSVLALNGRIAMSASAAGRYTRAGVAAAGLALIENLAGYGAAMRYQAKGSYQGKEDFGVNPDWGKRLKEPVTDPNGTYRFSGMQCVASVVWAYRQAGVNLVNAASGSNIGEAASKERRGDNAIPFDRGQGGDVIKQRGHYFMILDRLDRDGDGRGDAYLCYEMISPRLVLSVYEMSDVRNRILYDMSAVFENAGLFRDKARYWEDTFFIP